MHGYTLKGNKMTRVRQYAGHKGFHARKPGKKQGRKLQPERVAAALERLQHG